ncbi:MAG: N-acetyltransferase [Aquificaceae bacterium]
MVIRKAKLKDAGEIYNLINQYAKEGILLPRSLNSIYENIRDFWVCEENGRLVGCAALHIVWEDLAEIKSLAVSEEHKGKGIGTMLVEECLKEAEELGVKRVFVLTYAQGFFSKLNFEEVEKIKLPHKVWGECINCVKFPSCDEIAMWIDLGKVSLKHDAKV